MAKCSDTLHSNDFHCLPGDLPDRNGRLLLYFVCMRRTPNACSPRLALCPAVCPRGAQDLRGTWAVQYDAFKGVAQVRSLLFPGYFFYYAANELTWGSLYVGDGLRNNDLIFML